MFHDPGQERETERERRQGGGEERGRWNERGKVRKGRERSSMSDCHTNRELEKTWEGMEGRRNMGLIKLLPPFKDPVRKLQKLMQEPWKARQTTSSMCSTQFHTDSPVKPRCRLLLPVRAKPNLQVRTPNFQANFRSLIEVSIISGTKPSTQH